MLFKLCLGVDQIQLRTIVLTMFDYTIVLTTTYCFVILLKY